jgi:hypothetical protein
MTLDHEDIEEIALRVAQLLRDAVATSAVRLVDAATVADMLGVERDWMYAHAQDLGAVRLGGPRGRVRFDVCKLERVLTPTANPDGNASAERVSRRRRDEAIELLPYEK